MQSSGYYHPNAPPGQTSYSDLLGQDDERMKSYAAVAVANVMSPQPSMNTLQDHIGTDHVDDSLTAEDDDSDDNKKPGKRNGRRKIKIEYIEDKTKRHITFSKRKAGIMKKAYELSTLTGTQVLLLVVSETGLVYTFTTPKLQPLVTQPEGKNLIQTCLNAPDNQETVE